VDLLPGAIAVGVGLGILQIDHRVHARAVCTGKAGDPWRPRSRRGAAPGSVGAWARADRRGRDQRNVV
jgi:hypothetical protein